MHAYLYTYKQFITTAFLCGILDYSLAILWILQTETFCNLTPPIIGLVFIKKIFYTYSWLYQNIWTSVLSLTSIASNSISSWFPFSRTRRETGLLFSNCCPFFTLSATFWIPWAPFPLILLLFSFMPLVFCYSTKLFFFSEKIYRC